MTKKRVAFVIERRYPEEREWSERAGVFWTMSDAVRELEARRAMAAPGAKYRISERRALPQKRPPA